MRPLSAVSIDWSKKEGPVLDSLVVPDFPLAFTLEQKRFYPAPYM